MVEPSPAGGLGARLSRDRYCGVMITEVHDVLARYRDAVYDQDVDAFIALYSPKVRIFEMWKAWELLGHDGARALSTIWFASIPPGEKVAASFYDVHILEYDDAAFVNAYVRFSGCTPDANGHFTPVRHQDNRITWVLERVDGQWLIVHEHTSAPIDDESGKAMLHREDLVEEDAHKIWSVRPERAGDEANVHGINAAAFPTLEEAELVDALRADPDAWIGGLSMLSFDGDRPVGHALLTRCYIGDVPALALAPCAVLPEFQFTGAGTAAINGTLDAARAMGEKFVVVLGHPDYYPRFGFKRAVDHGVRLSIEVPEEALMVLSLQDAEEFPSGTVRYAAAFGI